MRKFAVKTTIIFFSVFYIITVVISILVYLLNAGKLTHFIERRISNKTNLGIKIEDIHLDIFSSLQLKHISLQGLNNQRRFTLGCRSLTICYKPFELLRRRIRNMVFSDILVNLNAEKRNIIIPSMPSDYRIPAFSIKDIYPGNVLIEDITVNETTVHITTDHYVFILNGMKIQVKEIQTAKPFDISIKGDFSISNRMKDIPSDISGSIDIDTRYTLSDDELIFSDKSCFSIINTGNFLMTGSIRHVLSDPEINVETHAQGFDIMDITNLLKDFSLVDLSPLKLEGICNLELGVQGNPEGLRLRSNIAVKDLEVSYKDKFFRSEGFNIPAETKIYPLDPTGKIAVKSRFAMPENRFWSGDRLVANLSLPISIDLDYPDGMTIISDGLDGDILMPEHGLRIKELVSGLKVDIDLKDNSRIPFDVSLNTTVSDPVQISGTYNVESGMVQDTEAIVRNIDCHALSETLVSFIPVYCKDWLYGGRMAASAYVRTSHGEKGNGVSVKTDISFTDVRFSSPDYEYFGEKINGNLVIDTSINKDLHQIPIHTGATLEPFLIQLGTFSPDMKGRKTYLSLKGKYDRGEESLSEIEGAVSWNELGKITIDGSVFNLRNNLNVDLNIKVKDLSNKGFFETFVKETVEYSHPALFKAGIDGETDAHFHVKGRRDAMDLDGNIIMEKASLDYKDISVEGLNLDFPISITYPGPGIPVRRQDISDSQYGTVKIRKISYGQLELNDIQTRPIVISNNFLIKDPLTIPAFEGIVDIRDLSIGNLINQNRRINLVFQISDIDLQKVTTAFDLTPFEGVLGSSVISFQQDGDKLSSNGTMEVSVFGGEIIISRLTIKNLFQSLMGIEFSAGIRHLDLGKISSTYREWGNITGIINGDIKDFRLVAGEPSSFDIEMRTERHPEVEQTVSAKFLKNFVPGIGKVLDKAGFTDYKYSIMGLRARLENDYIRFQGAVREGGKELFMKGAGLRKLEIVFPNVDRRVPFKTFLNSFRGILGTEFEDTRIQFQ